MLNFDLQIFNDAVFCFCIVFVLSSLFSIIVRRILKEINCDLKKTSTGYYSSVFSCFMMLKSCQINEW